MNPIQTLRNTLADARIRAQYEGREVTCIVDENGMTEITRRAPGVCGPHCVRAVVRPDEPILFCGLLPEPLASDRLSF
jgi:hypothetical protein